MVILGDNDSVIRGFLKSMFSELPTQLCVWHIIQNAAFNLRKKWEYYSEETSLGHTSDGRKTGRTEIIPHFYNNDAIDEAVANQLVKAQEDVFSCQRKIQAFRACRVTTRTWTYLRQQYKQNSEGMDGFHLY